jgi:DNA-binding NtrC family response regulator
MSGKKILIIDDEANLRLLLRSCLALGNYDIEEAENFASGIEKFQQWHPDAAIIDYVLPDNNGLELLSAFRQLDPQAILIMLTGNPHKELAQEANQRGANFFLTKPFSVDELLSVIKNLLSDRPLIARHVTP